MPYLTRQRLSVNYDENLHFSITQDLRKPTMDSIHARRAPIPAIESQTKLSVEIQRRRNVVCPGRCVLEEVEDVFEDWVWPRP